MEFKIRKSILDIVLLCLSFYEISIIPHMIFLIIKYTILLYLLLSYIKEAFAMKRIVTVLVLYGGTTILSTLLNQDSFNKYVASLVYVLHLFVIYLTVYSFLKNRTLKELTGTIIKTYLYLMAVTDTLMLIVNYNFYNPSERYFIGDKFAVSYLHCFISMLINWKIFNDKEGRYIYKKIVAFAFSIFSILICIRVTCTTGMLICIFLTVMLYIPIPQAIKKLMSNPKILILFLAVMNILIFGSYELLSNPVIDGFISNVLGKSGTWIGRINIYKIIIGVILEKLWIGYGYFSNVINEIMGFGNAQNGVLKILVDSGIIGLIGFAALVFQSMNPSKNLNKQEWPLIVFVYSMAIASIVEINLTDYLFFLTCAISFAICHRDKNSKEV